MKWVQGNKSIIGLFHARWATEEMGRPGKTSYYREVIAGGNKTLGKPEKA